MPRMVNARPALLFLLLVSHSIFSSACSSSTPPAPEPEAKELKAPTSAALDSPEGELFRTAKRYYSTGLYTLARETFEGLRDGHPLGAYSEFSELMVGNCFFRTRDFDKAAPVFEEFAKNHPSTSGAEYALYMNGRSNQLIVKEAGRDSSALMKAMESYEKLYTAYPQSVYASSAREKRQEVINLLAEYERMVADFYRNQGKIAAYNYRKARYEKTWRPLEAPIPSETSAEGAIDKEIAPEGMDTASAIEEAAPSPALLARQSNQRATSTISEKNLGNTTASSPIPTHSTTYVVQNVSCVGESPKKIFIFLNKQIEDPSFGESLRELSSTDGRLKIAVPDSRADVTNISCDETDNVKLFADGTVEIATDLTYRGFTISNPPRIVLMPDTES